MQPGKKVIPPERKAISKTFKALPGIAVFYGHSPETHRWGASEEDFYLQSQALRKDPSIPVKIGVRRTNFHRLDKIVRLVHEIRKKQAIPSQFPLEPFIDIKSRFHGYLERLKEDFPDIQFFNADPQLDIILDKVQIAEGDILRALGPVCKDVFTGPRYLLFNLSGNCNTDCIYCRKFSPLRKDKLKSRDRYLSLDTVKGVVKDAQVMGVEKVLLVGEGEPSLHPRFSDILGILTRNGMQFNLSTNGMLLHRYADALAMSTCHALTISMSWVDEQSFKAIRPGTPLNSMQRIRENIRMILSLKPRPIVILLHAINNRNHTKILKMVRDAKELGADCIWFQMTHLSEFSKSLMLDESQLKAVKKDLGHARKLAKSLRLPFASFINFELENYSKETGEWSGMLEQGCYVGWHFAFIELGSLLSFCCGVRIIDSLEKRSFRELWYSDLYARYRNDGLIMHKENPLDMKGNPLYDEFCDSCDNHDQNKFMLDFLEETGLLEFVER